MFIHHNALNIDCGLFLFRFLFFRQFIEKKTSFLNQNKRGTQIYLFGSMKMMMMMIHTRAQRQNKTVSHIVCSMFVFRSLISVFFSFQFLWGKKRRYKKKDLRRK